MFFPSKQLSCYSSIQSSLLGIVKSGINLLSGLGFANQFKTCSAMQTKLTAWVRTCFFHNIFCLGHKALIETSS